jgi:uncharacterized protein (DUF1330 family)
MTWPGHARRMTAYALAHLHNNSMHEDVFAYLDRIQATMDPYGGHFLIHGPTVDVREGEWPGTVVLLEFPSLADARDWYDSPAYRKILALRTDHIRGDVIIVDGVPTYHSAADVAATLRLLVAG